MQLVFTSHGNERSTSLLLCDWLFTVLDYLDKTKSDSFYEKVCELVKDDSNIDIVSIFLLLVSNLDVIFDILKEAEINKEITIREDIRRTFNEIYKESEEFFIPLISLLTHPKFDKLKIEECKKIFVSKIINDGNMSGLRINVMKMYYDIFGEDLELLVSILEYAAKYGEISKIESSLGMLEKKISCISDSNIELKRKLYLSLYNVVNKNDQMYLDKKAYDYLKGYFETFNSRDDMNIIIKRNPTIVDIGVKFIISSILLPDILFFDSIVSLPIFQYIKDNFKEYQVLIELCNICLEGTVCDFHDNMQNKKEYKSFIEKYDILRINEANIVNKLQLLTLSTLAKGKTTINLDDLQKELRLSSFDTQDAVVNAISVGLIDGDISENLNTLNINCVTKRQFGKNEWDLLDKKLTQWIGHITELSSLLCNNNNSNNINTNNNNID